MINLAHLPREKRIELLQKLPEAQRIRAYTKYRFDAFTMRSFNTITPGADLLWNWHNALMCEYLEECRRKRITRLIINVPPRTLKSITVTCAWPAFTLGHDPTAKFIAASYAATLSMKHSIDTRLIMETNWYRQLFPGTQIVRDQNTKTKFVTSERGHRIATSVTGSALGEGADYLIVDDPLNPAQALSEVERNNANTWFDQAFYTRLNDKEHGVIVVVMQRLHNEDLTGHLLAKGGWEHLKLPLHAPETHIFDFGRVKRVWRKDECLHPERFTPKVVADTKRSLGSYAYAGQYEQEPVPLEGGLIKKTWLKYYKTAAKPQFTGKVQSWDTANKAKNINDPSCCQTFGLTANGYYVDDYLNERMEYPELKRAVVTQFNKHNVNGGKVEAVLIEDKGSGTQLIQELRRETQIPVIAIMPEGDKTARLSAQSAKVEAGLLYLPEDAIWLNDYELELCLFPNAAHDEVPDTLSQFLKWQSDREANQFRVRRL